METRTRTCAGLAVRCFAAVVIAAIRSQAAAADCPRSGGLEIVNTVEIEDLGIPLLSTVPANAGEAVCLNVREFRRPDHGDAGVVLMLHGASIPALAGFDLRTDHYDWALWLARSGFDVFVLDQQGSGRSSRPAAMEDPCNVPIADQLRALIPNPLPATCAPSYPFQLNTSASDWSELDATVDFIRALRGVDRVHLVAWSQGSFRAGPYSVMHPEKVESLFLLAPLYNPTFRSGTGPGGFDPPLRSDGTSIVPVSGTPMTLRTKDDLLALWNADVGCADQLAPGIQDVVWDAINESDPLGETWGAQPDGVLRVRTPTLWGWNQGMASRVSVPVLILQGQFDHGGGGVQKLADLYDTVQSATKLRFRVQCAGHFILWEAQRRVVHHISKEWLKHGSVAGFTKGEFLVDTEGNLSWCERVLASGAATNACVGER